MKKEYDTSVKEAIERVMSVFSEYIKTTPYFDIVWSGKVGYKMPRIRRKEDLPDVMTMPLVAKALGCSLTVAYRLLKRDDFPHTVSGQRVYIDKGKFLSWLDAQTQMEKRDHYGW